MPDTTVIQLPLTLNSKPQHNVWNLPPQTQEDIDCMGLNIYHEARGEPISGQYAVAEVVINRVNHYNFSNTVCDVIKHAKYNKWDRFQQHPLKNKCHFSWYCDGLSDAANEYQSVQTAQYIARDILTNPRYTEEIDYSLYYHRYDINPYWNRNMTYVERIGVHKFWSE